MMSLALLSLVAIAPTLGAPDSVLKQHIRYSLADQSQDVIVRNMTAQIQGADIPIPDTAPTILVVPGWQRDGEADRGMAAAMRVIRDRIDSYDTVVIVGGYYPNTCGGDMPTVPISAYSGRAVSTKLGDFDVDTDLRSRLWAEAGTSNQASVDELIESSDFFDHPAVWLRSLFPLGKVPRTKILPLLLYAVMRDQVQFSADILNRLLFTKNATSPDQFGIAGDGKRYLVIIPITVASGSDLFNLVSIENVLSDITLKNDVGLFEKWLYYLSGHSGATFSKTVASQVLVVRLSAAAAAVTDTGPSFGSVRASWKWRMLTYYTTFDAAMNREKMARLDYRGPSTEAPPDSDPHCAADFFHNSVDNPSGHYIYYTMALSLEPPLYESSYTDKKGVTHRAKLTTPLAPAEEFPRAAVNVLMEYTRKALRGEPVKVAPAERAGMHLPRELSQRVPFSIRVYVLAEHGTEHAELKSFEKSRRKRARERTQVAGDDAALCPAGLEALTNHGRDMCMEHLLFEHKVDEFFSNEDVFASLVREARRIHDERLSKRQLARFKADLLKRYRALVKEGLVPPSKLRDVDINLQSSLVVEVSVYHSWELTNVFELVEPRGHFITLWDGRYAVCDVPETRPASPSVIFFRLAQCALKGGLDPWDWQRGLVHTYARERYTANVYDPRLKDEL